MTARTKRLKLHKADGDTIDRTVFRIESSGELEIVHVAETPELAEAFAAGFNRCLRWDTFDDDRAEIGRGPLEAGMKLIDEEERREAARLASKRKAVPA